MKAVQSVASYLRSRANEEHPFVIAHRGASAVAPENTLAAFSCALELGAPWIELDVQRTADDVPVVIHDRTLRRTTRLRTRVAEIAAAQLGQLDAGSWFAPEFAGERIPTLASTLALVRGRAMINIEIKAGGTARARSALLEAVIDVVREAGAERTTLLSSFDHGLISVAQYRAPAIARAVIASPMDIRRVMPRAREVRAEAVVISKRQLRASFVEEARRRELAVLVFTVDGPRDLLRSARAGVTGVFTNDVAGSLQALERNREKPDSGVRNRTIAN